MTNRGNIMKKEQIEENIESIANAAEYLRGIQQLMLQADPSGAVHFIALQIEEPITRIERMSENIQVITQ